MSPNEELKEENIPYLSAINTNGMNAQVNSLKFNVGDKVRITNYKKMFTKGYAENWSREIFTIDKALKTNPQTYRLKDEKGELIKGRFYQEELLKTKY